MKRLGLTYEMAENAPAPMEWELYSSKVMKQWWALLESEEGRTEDCVQKFLEQHPSMVPMPGLAHHDPFPGALISQPPLMGFFRRVPDFMWIACNSTTVFANAIEIEAPHKRWFNQNGELSADLRHALGQLMDWQKWFEDHGKTYFYDLFRVPTRFREYRSFRPTYTLIYGRRSEFDDTPERNETRARLEANLKDTCLMTFDRLNPVFDLRDYLCVSYNGTHYTAISFPPVIRLGPTRAGVHSVIKDRDQAILANPYIDPRRKEFLLERIGYWDRWVRSGLDNGYRAGIRTE